VLPRQRNVPFDTQTFDIPFGYFRSL